MVVLEVVVPSSAFVLEDALQEFPGIDVELERLVPTSQSVFPYLWVANGETPVFERAVATDAMVDQLERVARFDSGALYQITWEQDDSRLLHWSERQHDVALLQAEGRGEEWLLKYRFPSRERLSAFRSFVEEHGIDIRVVSLYDLVEPKMGQYDVTDKQRAALVEALELGYFTIPREADLGDVADSLGISRKAASERLRRGQANLVSNSLTINRPPGVGVSGE